MRRTLTLSSVWGLWPYLVVIQRYHEKVPHYVTYRELTSSHRERLLLPLVRLRRVMGDIGHVVLFDTRMRLRRSRLVVASSDHHSASRGSGWSLAGLLQSE